jgi:hypothetical protein
MNTFAVNKIRTNSAIRLAPSRHPIELDNSSARYSRVAMLEAVLTLKERRAKSRYLASAACVLVGMGSILVALFW